MKDYFYGETVPHEEDETGKRFYQFRVGALLAVLLMLLAGCAAVPECGFVEAGVVQTNAGPVFVMTLPQMQAMADRTRAI